MRVILESLRFVLIFAVLQTVLSIISYLILYPIFGDAAESYLGWPALIGTSLLLFFIYRNRGWGRDYINKSILWLSVIFLVLLPLLMPDLTPEHLHTTLYTYSYGLPLPFLTLYTENSTRFLIQNLFSGEIESWNLNLGGIWINLLLFYFFFRLISQKLFKKAAE